MCCRCSIEPSHRDGCFGYPQHLHGRGNLNTDSYRFFEACVVGAQNNRLIETAVLSNLNYYLGVKFKIRILFSLIRHVLSVLKRTVSLRWLFWVPSSFARAWKFRIQISIDLSRHALLVLKITCLGLEILKTNSHLSFEACVVGAQKNRLIEMAVFSTPNFCLGVEILNTNICLSFEACVVGVQENHLIEMAALGTLDFCMSWKFEYKFLSIFRSICCWYSKEPSH